jgi:hypothetical protein
MDAVLLAERLLQDQGVTHRHGGPERRVPQTQSALRNRNGDNTLRFAEVRRRRDTTVLVQELFDSGPAGTYNPNLRQGVYLPPSEHTPDRELRESVV